ncbi:MAG: RluA family pseudouridine synthase [Cytophagaceae bacterium]|jgi:23S rRNA pseudouridine1911/1915/1917 synthase|nr:RluA family pseudouridine synthase [Cytophagaceae bacterium]
MSENLSSEDAFLENDEELYEHLRIVCEKGQMQMRLDKFLMDRIANATRTKIQAAIESESVRINNQPTKASYKIKPLDVITICLPHPPKDDTIYPENIPLNIVHEDDDLLVVNKPAGMVVHPAYGNWTGTLVNALVYHFDHLPTHKNGAIRPGLVHRIDKDTSGLLVIAKNEFSMNFLARQFADHSIERTYYALVWGVPKEDSGTIQSYLGRSLKDRKIMASFSDPEKGKRAVTHYKVLERFHSCALVQCNLETGRTHQIRVHFQSIGHPLFGDTTYGGDRIVKGNPTGAYKLFAEKQLQALPRQGLHAKTLGFLHPTTKAFISFDSPLADDLLHVIQEWRQFALQVDAT